MFWSEADFLTLCCEYRTCAGTTADSRSNSRTLTATSNGTDCRSEAGATRDDCSIALLGRLGDLAKRLRRNVDRFVSISNDLSQRQLDTRPPFYTAGILGIDDASAYLRSFCENRLAIHNDRLGQARHKLIAGMTLVGTHGVNQRDTKLGACSYRCLRSWRRSGLKFRFRFRLRFRFYVFSNRSLRSPGLQ